MRFTKVESIGNDFVLVEEADIPGLPSDREHMLAKIAVLTSERHFGVGSDGLLVVSKSGENSVKLRMFNPDGTEDFCGNGIRCAAEYACAHGWVASQFTIQHGGQDIPIEVNPIGMITSTLGRASYAPDDVPHTGIAELYNVSMFVDMIDGMPIHLFGSALTTGSTHVVLPIASLPDEDTFLAVSPRLEVDPRFPARTSIIWSQEVAENSLKLRIWERGVGETFGCGTGSSAAVADYLRRKNRGGTVQVESKGGQLEIRMDAWNAPIKVSGRAQIVFEGDYFLDELTQNLPASLNSAAVPAE
ncbi:MAG: diaminopimelate epimerase [Armatimonadetes bacterium]|nr:diaminopimelate epimerase [Armatimonadota bacterium]